MHLPCTLPSSAVNLIQLLIKPFLFCSNKYSAISLASGKASSFKTTSSIIIEPLSVNLLGFHPSVSKRSAICLRLPTLKTVTLSFKALPVFSDTRLVVIGLNTCCNSCSILPILSITVANNI